MEKADFKNKSGREAGPRSNGSTSMVLKIPIVYRTTTNNKVTHRNWWAIHCIDGAIKAVTACKRRASSRNCEAVPKAS